MDRQDFPLAWLITSLMLFLGVPAVHIWVVLPNAEPDGIAAVGGFCLGIILMPIGFLSLLTLGVWVSRKRRLQDDLSLQLNLSEQTLKGPSQSAVDQLSKQR